MAPRHSGALLDSQPKEARVRKAPTFTIKDFPVEFVRTVAPLHFHDARATGADCYLIRTSEQICGWPEGTLILVANMDGDMKPDALHICVDFQENIGRLVHRPSGAEKMVAMDSGLPYRGWGEYALRVIGIGHCEQKASGAYRCETQSCRFGFRINPFGGVPEPLEEPTLPVVDEPIERMYDLYKRMSWVHQDLFLDAYPNKDAYGKDCAWTTSLEQTPYRMALRLTQIPLDARACEGWQMFDGCEFIIAQHSPITQGYCVFPYAVRWLAEDEPVEQGKLYVFFHEETHRAIFGHGSGKDLICNVELDKRGGMLHPYTDPRIHAEYDRDYAVFGPQWHLQHRRGLIVGQLGTAHRSSLYSPTGFVIGEDLRMVPAPEATANGPR